MKNTFILLTMISIFLLTGCAETYQTEIVQATVVETEHEKAYKKSERKKVNGVWKTKTKNVPEKYEVDLEYKGIEVEVEGRTLYNKVKEGDQIPVTYEKGFDKEGKLVSERIIYNGK